jgi:hypothetical protein
MNLEPQQTKAEKTSVASVQWICSIFRYSQNKLLRRPMFFFDFRSNSQPTFVTVGQKTGFYDRKIPEYRDLMPRLPFVLHFDILEIAIFEGFLSFSRLV